MAAVIDGLRSSRAYPAMKDYEPGDYWEDTHHKDDQDTSNGRDVTIKWNTQAPLASERQAQATEVLCHLFHSLGEAGVADSISRVELYRHNDKGEIPCLVRLKRDPHVNGEGPSLIESIHLAQRDLWRCFRPLPWRFATVMEDTEPLPRASVHFLGANPELQASASR